MAEILINSGTQFDPQIVKVFMTWFAQHGRILSIYVVQRGEIIFG